MRTAACIGRRNLATLHASARSNEIRIADSDNSQVNEGLNIVHGGGGRRAGRGKQSSATSGNVFPVVAIHITAQFT
jgi:hypothetical protein